MAKRYTQSAIAERAGLSQATVSRVLAGQAGRHRIAHRSVLTVIEAARELGYPAAALDRLLADQGSRCVALLLDSQCLIGHSRDWFGPSTGGAIDTLRRSDVHVLLCSDYHRFTTLGLDQGLSRRVDGVLAFGSMGGSGWSQVDLESQSRPVVFMHRTVTPSRNPVVRVDFTDAIAALVQHLARSGRTRVFYIAPQARRLAGVPQPFNEADERGALLRAACHAHGLAFDQSIIAEQELGGLAELRAIRDYYRQQLQRLRSRTSRADAIIAYNDTLAHAVLLDGHERGRDAPRDYALIGIDDHHNDFIEPALSSIRQPLAELGSESGRILLELITDSTAADRHRGREHCLPATFIARATS
ncbi:MAG: LacI family DNA-binding transcriptional regulator [Planctomycetota bacterium]|jgi:LacI family transcriptional regulator|nr:LacI family DNA-binding transcriptional regulator [Planctomycetota bacterium]